MMLANMDYAPASFWSVATNGASESARFIAEQLLRGRIKTERSQTLGAGVVSKSEPCAFSQYQPGRRCALRRTAWLANPRQWFAAFFRRSAG